MKTLRVRLNAAMLLLTGLSVGFAYLAYHGQIELNQQQAKIAESLEIRDLVRDLESESKKRLALIEIKKLKNKTKNKERKKALSNLVQAYNSINPKLAKRRLVEFEKSEKRIIKIYQWKAAQAKKKFTQMLFLAVLFPLFGLIGATLFFNRAVIKPMGQLYTRMMEFLIDQYSFRFSNPANNEIGNLERTFNSLAQKVLNNMDELKALDRAKSEFVSIASHELRTPLTSIKGSLGLLSNDIVGELDPAAKDLVKVAEQETDRLVRLINEMLDLAKIEARSITLKKDWQNLEDLMHKTRSTLAGFAGAAKVDLQVINEVGQVEVMVDSDRLQQVMTNLISNAIKYSPEGGQVNLRVSKGSEDWLEIAIIDQGPGISQENQGLIFEKFRQATDSSTPLVKGTGLGLAISKALVEEHGGKIGVRSTLGEGSTFFFTLLEWRKAVATLPTSSQENNEAA